MGTRTIAMLVLSASTLFGSAAHAGGALTLTASSTTVAPSGTATFTAGGGTSPYSFALSDDETGGSVDPASGAYVAGIWGPAADTIEVTDALGATADLAINVGAMLSVNPQTTFAPPRGALSFTSSDGAAPYTYSLSDNQSGGSIDAASGVYLAGVTGDCIDTITVTDANGTVVTANVTVGVGISILPARALMGPRQPIAFSASGGAGDYTFSLAQNGSGGSIDASSGAYVAGTMGSVSDIVRATDSDGNSTTVTVTIGPALSITPKTASVDPMGSLQLAAHGGSTFGYRFSLTNNVSGGSIDAKSGAYVAGGTVGVDFVQATDNAGNVATLDISVGSAFVVGPANPSTAPRGSLTFTATGGTGSGIAWAFVSNASGGTIDSTSGAYMAGTTANVTDVIRGSDSSGNSAEVSITVGSGVSVTPANASVQSGGSMSFSVSGGSGSGYIWSLTHNESGATIDSTTGAYVAGTASGSDTVSVVDSLGNAAAASVNVMPSSATLSSNTTLGTNALTPIQSPAKITSAAPAASGGCSMSGGSDERSLLGLLLLAFLMCRRFLVRRQLARVRR